VATGDDRHAGRDGRELRGDLVAHGLQHLGRCADEGDARVDAGAGEARVLGQESVSGMHRLAAARQCNLDEAIDVEVAIRKGIRAVSEVDIGKTGIGVGIHGH